MPETLNDSPLLRPVAGQPGQLEPIPGRRKGDKKGELHVWGEVLVRNGDTVFRARNKIVGQGLRHMHNVGMLGATISGTNLQGSPMGGSFAPCFETNQLSRSYMRVGVGGGSTTDATTGLTAAHTTNPDSTAATSDNPSSGVYRRKFTATWNAGSLPAITVSEIGIFGYLVTPLGTSPNISFPSSNTGSGNNGSPVALFARLSGADSEFVAFTVNTAVPLVIEYRVVWTFT